MVGQASTRGRLEHAMLLILTVALSVAFLFPVYWMVISSLKTEQEILKIQPSLLSFRPTLSNYETILAHPEDTPILRWFVNSAVIAVSFAALSVFLSTLAGFALARMEFPGRKLYLGILLASLVIPPMVLLIPNYVIVDWLRWTDTYAAVILPGLGGVFGVLLLRQYFVTLPVELEEAAVIDGANSCQVLRHVIFPLSKSMITTLFVMNFMASWNDYFWPLIVLYSPEMRTMPVGMVTLLGRHIVYYGRVMAGATLMAIPSVILFLLVQRYYIRSIAQTGLKT